MDVPTNDSEIDVGAVILYLVKRAGGEITSRTRLEKFLYLASRITPFLDTKKDFDLDDAGPASSLVRRKLVALSSGELSEEFSYGSGHCIWTHRYKLTTLGEMTANAAAEELPSNVKQAIDETLRTYKNMPKSDLMLAVVNLGYEVNSQ